MSIDQPDYKPVYIMGAGASKMLGAPLLADFLTRAREIRYAPSFAQSHGEIIAERLSRAFDEVFLYQGELLRIKAYLGSDLDNLENLFSMLDMDLETQKLKSTSLRLSFLSLVVETLRTSVKTEGDDWITYAQIIKSLAQPALSSFVTFNYDLAIEQALCAKNVHLISDVFDYDYCTQDGSAPTSERSKRLLKLHGSSNWVRCDECQDFRVLPDYAIPLKFEGMRGELHNQSKCNGVNRFQNLLIPPTWNKSNNAKQISSVWQAAIEEISTATHLFVIGYSFPSTDAFFDQLLGLALARSRNLKTVVVVNPSDSVRDALTFFFEKHFLSKHVKLIPAFFAGLRMIRWPLDIISKEKMDGFIAELYRQTKDQRVLP